MLKPIAIPFGKLMLWLYHWTGNYGVAVILFALVVKLILLPFQLKSKKSMMRTSRMTPRLKELEKKFGNDQQRYQQEMNKLYKEEGINPMSGCIWSLIPFPILIALYQAIRYPITMMMGVAEELMAEGGVIYEKLIALGYDITQFSTGRNAVAYEQIYQSQFITSHFDQFAGLSDKLTELSYRFLGIDLGLVPNVRFWAWDNAGGSLWPVFGLFLIPIVSAALSYFSMVIANKSNPQTAATQQSQKSMMLTMPLVSLWICFTMPGVMGIYWIAQSVFSIIQDSILTKIFNKQLDIEDADRIERDKAREAELEAKRAETERLKAEGATVVNKNTSKKKQQAAASQKETERRAAELRAEREAKRRARGIVEDVPDSQVGNRRYARGRAYVADRYTNPEEAEEKTLAAAEESAVYSEEHELPVEETVVEAVAEDVVEESEAVEEAAEEVVDESDADAGESEEEAAEEAEVESAEEPAEEIEPASDEAEE